MFTRADTIAAIATAPGPAALGIVRISGPRAAVVLDAIVPRAKAPTKPRHVAAATARHPRSGTSIDEVLCFFCPAPKTATGEDTAEIHGHGGPLILKQLLDAALEAGARVAQPGEFTYRAFRNGRIDLTQAEAVMGLIGARSERAAQVMVNQLAGDLGRSLSHDLDAIINVSAQVEAGLDFPDEDLPLEKAEEIANHLEKIGDRLSSIRDSYSLGSKLTEGARIAIVGPPNAGKSSLLNKLVGEDRVLVDPDPGTTRDVIEARSEACGIPLVFVDTAGLRKNAGRVERRGMEKTLETIRGADLVVIVIDGADRGEKYEDQLDIPGSLDKLLVAVNKVDLPTWTDANDLKAAFKIAPRVPTSALTGEGMDRLIKTIAKMLGDRDDEDTRMLTTQRQYAAVDSCVEHVKKAALILCRGNDPELAAADLRWARESLASLWGRSATDEMLDAIFSRFCIGK
ncbi:MAG: tRNA uridine-5-carboxymethylaminomethyl(34) synthesis GTPase MnmE [Proteobacteria bacterium]|nr:tRNA uridine-5-carboxymethylaminomethyl(34) synthesis GTPase MnmE [Pseudomonadota bacterium]